MSSCLEHLEWRRLGEHLDGCLASPLARATQAERADSGRVAWERSHDVTQVQRWLTEQDGLEAALEWHTELPIGAQLQRVEALEPELQQAARGATLDPIDLRAVGELADVLSRLAPLVRRPDPGVWDRAEASRHEGHAALVQALPGLVPHSELAADLLRAIVDEGPQGEPVLADAASPALARARAQMRTARQTLVRQAERLVRRTDMADALADAFWTEREGRVVLPVRSSGFSRGGQGGTVKGIIHGASTSGHTLFVEPSALVDDNNRLRESQMAVRAEERRVLAELSARVGSASAALIEGLTALQRLDQIRARLRIAEQLGAVRPQIIDPETDDTIVDLSDARHPLMVLAGTDVVANDLRVSVGGGLVISGPNAGGKTVALKTLGLCVLMAQAGLRLPTSTPAAVPLFRRVITDVGDDQSISANLSTFSAHIGHVIEALEHATDDPSGTLVLLDEVAVGTDPEQGAALAEAILCGLSSRGATVVVTTHYERLKLLATHGPPGKFANAAVGFDLAQLRPTFELHLGVPGSSSAIAVARRLGVDPAVLHDAESMLSDDRLQVDELLQALEAERVALAQERTEVETVRRELLAERARLVARERRELDHAQTQQVKAHEAATQELRALEGEIRRRKKALRQVPVQPTIEAQVPDAEADARNFTRQARQAVAQGRPSRPPAEGPVPEQPKVGDRVFVETLGLEGKVLVVKGERVTVQLPLAKTTVDRSALRARTKPPRAAPTGPPPSRPSSAARHFGADPRVVDRRLDNMVDLRGQRAEDAQTMVEVFLDRAIGDDLEVVIIRHGHGSGALRKVIREHLGRLPHVKTHRSGLVSEGGDAVTVVWVRG